jgi:CheY-like chemotaxis protein
MKRIVAVVSDLMFAVQIQDTGKRAGLATVMAKSAEQAIELASGSAALVVLDLNASALQPLHVIEVLKTNPATATLPLIAFVPHVQVELKQEAERKGCDVVLARSAFAQNLPELLNRFVVGSVPTPSVKGIEV